jgi:carbonic anhydrase
MDSRLDVHGALGLAIGDAHVLRNAGGVVTDDVIRSLVISQRLLGTREIILIHHTDCGMVKFTEDGLKAEIERDTGIRPPWATEAFTDLDADVVQSIARLKASPFVPCTDKIRGFVFDIETGLLREVRLRRVRACRQEHRASRGNPAGREAPAPAPAPPP